MSSPALNVSSSIPSTQLSHPTISASPSLTLSTTQISHPIPTLNTTVMITSNCIPVATLVGVIVGSVVFLCLGSMFVYFYRWSGLY